MTRSSHSIWTSANIVTMLRILGVPLFIVIVLSPWPDYFTFWADAWLWKPWLATLVFIILAATDGLDGYLARSRQEVTNFGKFVDPLADKILTTAALLVLIELHVVPSWPVFIILCREFIVAGIRMLAAAEGMVIAASWYGKAKTVVQIIAIVLFLIKDSPLTLSLLTDSYPLFYTFAWICMGAAVILTLVSMLDYLSKARDILGFASKKAKCSSQGISEDVNDALRKQKGDAKQETCREFTPEILEKKARQIIELARKQGYHLATAESLTGGLIAGTLTSVPGSSEVVEGGLVTYTYQAKEALLGVSAERLALTGAVDEEVARQMARGVQEKTSAELCIAVTGIAGPGGAEPNKPVGTVYFALVNRENSSVRRHEFSGNREEVRLQTVSYAFDLLRSQLED